MALVYLLGLCSAMSQPVGVVWAKFKAAMEIWEYLKMFPDWIYLKQLEENKSTIDRRLKQLVAKLEDIDEESRSGKKRKREVDNWYEDAKRVRADGDALMKEASETENRYLPCIKLENRSKKYLKEIEFLLVMGKFSQGYFLDVPTTSREPLLTKELAGQHGGYVERIMEWLNDLSVKRIGIYGVEGVGKTAVLTHVQNRLTESSNFEHVIWVSVPKEKPSVVELQDAIAKRVGLLNLTEERESITRTAMLHNFLVERGKCVIIVDDFGKLPIDEVGIQGCTLVLSTPSFRDCRRSDCNHSLEIKPLPDEEAMVLFKKILCPVDGLGLEVQEIIQPIVRELKGLPQRIIDLAGTLKGVDDINEWRDVLNEVTDKKSHEVPI